ncbi:MAG TPA: GNAT family N-acetyltransferase [Gemmatimonadales bacterium]|nr:GNAT family N-acetyltransferase [Gemmatimonadales bacterium]
MTGTLTIRPLAPGDRDAWEPLWLGYLTFYKAVLPAETTELTWQRFHDPAVPIHALGAFEGTTLLGIVHYIYHYSCWSPGPYCYLQDLFTTPESRGKGVGRSLINAVYDAARTAGASRVYWLTHETNAEAMVLYNKVADRSGFLQYRHMLG